MTVNVQQELYADIKDRVMATYRSGSPYSYQEKVNLVCSMAESPYMFKYLEQKKIEGASDQKLSKLQKEYQNFFSELLEKYGATSPSDLSKDQKLEFFNAIGAYWENGEGPNIDPKDIPTPEASEKEIKSALHAKSGVYEAVYTSNRTGRIKDLGLVKASSVEKAHKMVEQNWGRISKLTANKEGVVNVFELSEREVLGCLENGELESYMMVISRNRDKTQEKHSNVVFGAALELDGTKMISVMVDNREVGHIQSKAMSDDYMVWEPNDILAEYMESRGTPTDKVTSIRSNDLGSVMVGLVSCFNTDYTR